MKLPLVILEGHLYLAAVIAVFGAELAVLIWGLWSRRPLLGLVAVFAMVPLLRSTVVAVRVCFLSTPPPGGLTLRRSEGTGLFQLVEEIRNRLGGPAVDDIIVTGGFDARAAVYRTGWAFSRRRALVVGLPVLTTLSMAELRAVVAHELAHYAGAHDGYAAWVYRTQRSWFELRTSLNRRLATPVYVYWLIHWYVPRLNRAASAVSRRHELMADRAAARIAGSRAAADALVAFEAGERFAETALWPGVETSHKFLADPPGPFSQMLAWDARHASDDLLAEILTDDSQPGDTHPTLAERLAALGEQARLPPPCDKSAGVEVLGAGLHTLARRLDEEWLAQNGESWRRHHAVYVEQRATLERLAAADTPTADERFTRGQLVEALESADDALPFYKSAAAEGHARAGAAAGRLLLERLDPTGIPFVEDAMSRDESLVPEGCGLLSAYYLRTDQRLVASRYIRRARRHQTLARLERPGQVTG